jgi:uncharacterized small protein (DUF1192 family)
LYDHNPMTTAAHEQMEQLSREELLALVIRQQEIITLLQAEVAALKAELEKFQGENIFDALVKLMGKPIDRYLQPSSP